MKFTIAFLGLLAITTSWAEKEKKADEVKDKREAAVGYPAASHSYQAPSLSNEGASAISIGAGYSVGGARPSYSSYEQQGFTGSHALSPESLPASGHATIQLAPITYQPSQGNLIGTDLSQLMSKLQEQLNSGALTLQAPGGYGGSLQSEGHSGYGSQEQSIPQYTISAPQQHYSVAEQHQPSVPSYATGTKGLGSYSSTGPVLFNPTDSKTSTPTFNYAAPSSGHSFGSGGISLGSGGHYYAGAAGSFGESLGGGNSLASSPYKSFGNSYASSGKNTFKPSAYIGSLGQADPSHGVSALSSSYGAPSFSGASSLSGSHGGLSLGSVSQGISFGSGHGGHSLGSSSPSGHSLGLSSLGGHSIGSANYGGHSLGSGSFGGHSLSSGSHGISLGSGGLSGLSLSSGGHGSHGALSLGSGGHGSSFGGSHGVYGSGASKYISNAYLPAKEGFSSLSSYSGLSATPSTSYGIPTATHAASSHNPQYYKSQPSYSNFGSGSSSYRSPSSSFGSSKSYPKYSAGGYSSLSSPYESSKDPLQGAYSENSYNTIKYSEELKASPQ